MKRVENTVAHYLARITPDVGDKQFFFEDFSNCICTFFKVLNKVFFNTNIINVVDLSLH